MRIENPQPIKLTNAEQKIASRIRFNLNPNLDRDAIIASCEQAYELMVSLVDRGAIPKDRLEFFTKAEHNIGSARSRLDVFRANGVSTDDVFRDPSFLQFHLRYLLYGPQLPGEVIAGFCEIVDADAGTSDMLRDQLRKFTRAQVRKHGLSRHVAADAFYLLALECGEQFNAKAIRDAARNAS